MPFKQTTILLLAITATLFLRAQQPLTKDQQQAQQAIVKMFAALSDRDLAGIKEYCTADISFYEYGQIWTMDSLINKAITQNTAADFKRSNRFEFIRTERDKNMAWVSYRLYSDIIREGKKTQAEWLETVILFKQGKQWKVAHLHSTLIKRN